MPGEFDVASAQPQGPSPTGRNRRAFDLLIRAYQHALDAERETWQFAIRMNELKALGLHEIDLTWLLSRGFAEQAIETTVPGDVDRSFRRLATRVIGLRTYFVLTTAGYEALGQPPAANSSVIDGSDSPAATALTSNGSATVQHGSDSAKIPVWDASQRELRFAGQLVKRYRVPAPNQELILAAFQEEGWPHGIDDPLPPDGDQDPIRRLQATVKSLNRNQLNLLIRFRGNGNGDRVCWDVVSDKP